MWGPALITKGKAGIVSYKAPWGEEVAPKTLEQTGMYEASANLLWLNPFPLGNVAQQIAGDAPQWRPLLEAVDKFMTLEAAIESSLASSQGTSGRAARLLFPITVPACCDDAADGGVTCVLGKFRVVAGHTYVWAWYLGMHRAMQAGDVACVAALWQMARTTTVHLRHGLKESQLATWSISHAEQARATEGVLGDSFPAFALKCLAVLGEMPLCHRGAHSSDPADGLTVRKATSKLLEAKVTFRGAKMNQTMANGVLIFRNTVDSGGLRMFADIENSHGREVMGLHYNKIVQLVQCCSAASKVVGIPAPELVEATLGALHFQLRQKLVSPEQVSVPWLVAEKREAKKQVSKAARLESRGSGFVVKAIARHAFAQHLGLECADLKEKAGSQVDSIVSDVETLLRAVATYTQFESAFTPPEDTTEPQAFLEEYKDKHMKSKLGREAVDLIYDVYGGEHDDMLAEHIKPDGEWAQVVDWHRCDIPAWTEMARQLSLHGSVSIDSSKPPSAARSRVLARSLSNASDEAKAEQKQKESERDKVWAAATTSRRKLVNFLTPRSSWKARDLDSAYEASSAFSWDGGKPTEKHRVFLFSADLIDESGNCWAKTMQWPAALGEECVKFMKSKTGHCDLLVFCDGRSRSSRQALERLNEDTRNMIDLWATYTASSRLGRRIAWGSDNKEMIFISFPVPRVQMPVKPRKDPKCGGVAGETTTHDATYSGVAPMSWASMTLVTDADKEKILGVTAGTSKKPRAKVFDTSFGQPLLWAERKTIAFWLTLFEDVDAGMIIDCSPGSGTAARAALLANIPYFGLARNEHHASFLCNVADRQALMMMRTAGSPLHHQDMAECISAHFSQLMASMETMDGAKDTEPDGEVTLDELLDLE